MNNFTITQDIAAPVETVWNVLDDFGDIQRWNDGVKSSKLTSTGPVGKGATRYCALAPLGGVNERIDHYEPNRRMTIELFDMSKLPINRGTADFELTASEGGTQVKLHYLYELNGLGRVAKKTTHRQLMKGLGGMLDGLKRESESTSI
jgi:uncharacterized protein YndB with AHSA1/START domain